MDNKKKIYYIHDNRTIPFKIEIHHKIKKVLIYNSIDLESDTNEYIYSDTPICEYDYETIFIGNDPHDNDYDGNTILIHLINNIYVYVGSTIFVFKSLNPIITFVALMGNNDVPYPYGIDNKGNVYLMIENIIILDYYTKTSMIDPYDYYYAHDDNQRFTIKSFIYKHHVYDLNGNIMDGTNVKLNSWKPNPKHSWTWFDNSNKIQCANSCGEYNKITKSEYIKMHKRYAKYIGIIIFKQNEIVSRNYDGKYNNLLEKKSRISLVKLYMCINEFLNKMNLIIDKNIKKIIIKYYEKYLINLNLLRQCAHAIDFIDGNLELYIYACGKYGKSLRYILKIYHTYNLLKNAVECTPSSIKYIEQTKELCELAIMKDPMCIKYVSDKTEELCIMAVKNRSYSFKFIGDLYESVTIYALQDDGDLIKFVNNQTIELCKLALDNTYFSLEYIKNPTSELVEYALFLKENKYKKK